MSENLFPTGYFKNVFVMNSILIVLVSSICICPLFTISVDSNEDLILILAIIKC